MRLGSLIRWSARAGVAALVAVAVLRAADAQFVMTPRPGDRIAEMRHHYEQVTSVYEAVVRGDLPAVRTPATELSAIATPVDAGPEVVKVLDAVREAARRVMVAGTLQEAAAPTAAMLAQCGACHRASAVYPTPSPLRTPDVGGIVGHMLDHQLAMDSLLQGLVIPSDARWAEGAKQLAAAPMARADLPPDHGLTPEVRQAEIDVHAFADRAATASDSGTRAEVFADLMLTCARCHGLHEQIWGPRTR